MFLSISYIFLTVKLRVLKQLVEMLAQPEVPQLYAILNLHLLQRLFLFCNF